MTAKELTTKVVMYGRQRTITCDLDCKHAWGRNWQGVKDSTAPIDPLTYEGNDAKPTNKKHNRWCARECERSILK